MPAKPAAFLQPQMCLATFALETFRLIAARSTTPSVRRLLLVHFWCLIPILVARRWPVLLGCWWIWH